MPNGRGRLERRPRVAHGIGALAHVAGSNRPPDAPLDGS
ncbi:hypothetical protein BSIN_3610 [Burkholderia singularis]|uniref:Uncharacterized protein n=1 Tax=Burkholderia singularis TaxID=1503053 RepID=A0A238H531_9BURK|nr:hypothetical protein BSIN_3610 [Burkholderia singularis]